MEINNVKLIYFSPTKTTKHVIEGIANGLQPVKITQLDMTLPQADQLESVGIQDDLVILGAPVYGGRIPQVAVNRLSKIRGKNTPAVVVVVYGNRDIDDALMELSDLAIKTGCRPVACGVLLVNILSPVIQFPLPGTGRMTRIGSWQECLVKVSGKSCCKYQILMI